MQRAGVEQFVRHGAIVRQLIAYKIHAVGLLAVDICYIHVIRDRVTVFASEGLWKTDRQGNIGVAGAGVYLVDGNRDFTDCLALVDGGVEALVANEFGLVAAK